MGLCPWRRPTSFMQLPATRSPHRIVCQVVEAIRTGESRKFYELHAWVVMPNHVYMLILPEVSLPKITHWIKGRTAREANLLLGRTGEPFWQHESYGCITPIPRK